MPLLEQIVPGRVGRAAAELEAAVFVEQAGREDGGIVRQEGKIGAEPAHHVFNHQSVVIEDEDVAAAGLPEGEIVVFREAADLVAGDELYLREVLANSFKVLRLKQIGCD